MKLTAVAVAISAAGCPMQAVGFLPTTPKISSQGFGAQLSSMLRSDVSSDGTSGSERNAPPPTSRARGARAMQMKSQATQVKTDVSTLLMTAEAVFFETFSFLSRKGETQVSSSSLRPRMPFPLFHIGLILFFIKTLVRKNWFNMRVIIFVTPNTPFLSINCKIQY